MQGHYDDVFEREHGCTEAEWLGWLPGAVRSHRPELTGPDQARVAVGSGSLHLRWQALAPRKIVLMQFPRLQVSYRFESVDESERVAFMRYFDLYMQRGGG